MSTEMGAYIIWYSLTGGLLLTAVCKFLSTAIFKFQPYVNKQLR